MSSRIQVSCPTQHITFNKDYDRGKGLVSTTCLPEYRAPVLLSTSPALHSTSHFIKIVIGVKALYPPHVFQNTVLLPSSTSHLIKIVIGVKALYPPHVFQNTGLLPYRAHHT